MAKDNLGLLNEISSQLKKLNQQSIRQDLQNKEYQERQLAQSAGGETAQDAGQFTITAAEDFKRRAKASIFSAKISESFTASGDRAKATVKENKEKEKDRKQEKKDRKLQALRTADKKVGLSTVVDAINSSAGGDEDSQKALSLIKVNTDTLVHMLGGIRTHLGMSNKAAEKARKAAIKAAMNAKRDKEEDKRENKGTEEKVVKMGKLATFMKNGPQSGAGNNLMGMLLGGLVVGAGLAIKSMIDGFKAGGIKGALKKLFFGSDKGGLGAAIAGAFKVGATFATAGLLIGGPVGALVGGIIGMAVGAFTGYFGSDGIKDMLSSTGDYLKEKGELIVFKVKQFGRFLADFIYKPGQKGNVSMNDTKAQFFGQEVNWTISGIGTSLSKKWNEGMAWLDKKIRDFALTIYNPTDNTVFGGLFTMPDWFDTVEQAISKMWGVMGDVGNAVKNALIYLLPDSFTDWAGWTVNGKIPSENTMPGRHSPEVSEVTGDLMTDTAIALNYPGRHHAEAYMKAMSSDSAGRAARFELSQINDAGYLLADGTMATEFNNQMKTTGHSRTRGLSDEAANEILRQRDMRLAMASYGERRGMDRLHPIHVDSSSNTGAVIVNNNYMDGGSQSSVDIHTHIDGSFPGGREIPWHLRGGY